MYFACGLSKVGRGNRSLTTSLRGRPTIRVFHRSYLENGLAVMHDGAERDRAVLQHLVPRLVKIMQRTQARLDFDQAFHGLACVPLST